MNRRASAFNFHVQLGVELVDSHLDIYYIHSKTTAERLARDKVAFEGHYCGLSVMLVKALRLAFSNRSFLDKPELIQL